MPLDDIATRRLESHKSDKSSSPTRTPSFDSIDNARFVPGDILAERYRIVGLLGKGGMGEVYRADDLKLAQPVALKFLPDHLLSDGAALARFHREVRVARQVSHKNVCRVYDIAEADGRHFLSMEYIKGEELSSLLSPLGLLPDDNRTHSLVRNRLHHRPRHLPRACGFRFLYISRRAKTSVRKTTGGITADCFLSEPPA